MVTEKTNLATMPKTILPSCRRPVIHVYRVSLLAAAGRGCVWIAGDVGSSILRVPRRRDDRERHPAHSAGQ